MRCPRLAVAVLATLLPAPTSAAVLHVPADYPTILAALDAAAEGDTVLVAPGTYSAVGTRTVVFTDSTLTVTAAGFLKDGVTLVSEAGPSHTLLEVSGNAVRCLAGFGLTGPAPLRVEGFTFRRSGGTGTMVYLRENDAAQTTFFEDCAFEGGASPNYEAGHLYSYRGGSLDVRRCEFLDSYSPADYGALGLVDGYATVGTLRVEDCRFVACRGRGILSRATSNTFARCTFVGCTVESNRGNIEGGSGFVIWGLADRVEGCRFEECEILAVRCDSHVGGSLLVTNSVFRNGGAGILGPGQGSVLRVERCSFEQLTGRAVQHHGAPGSSFAGNTVRDTGGIRWRDGEVTGNTFVRCDPWAVAVNDGQCDIRNNVLAWNTGDYPALFIWGSEITESCNLFWQNEADTFRPPLDPTDVLADPLFCDPWGPKLTVRTDSPCLPGNHPGGASCGRIGAFGEGCGPVSLDPRSWGRIKAAHR